MDTLGGTNSSGRPRNDPIPIDEAGAEAKGVSHAPLVLGGARAVPIPQSAAPKPVARPSAPTAAGPRPVRPAAPAGRIRGVRTFFTKLHPGAIEFLDEQITRWLSENPDVVIKQTNITVGEVQAKKTEPNILVTVWF